MSLYQARILPWLLDLTMRQRQLVLYRERVLAMASGRDLGCLAVLRAGGALTDVSDTRVFASLLLAAALTGCGEDNTAQQLVHADVAPGCDHIVRIGCSTCHVIPGVPGFRGRAGPSLAAFGERRYITKTLPNVPSVLLAWLQNASDLVPHTAMPDLPVSEKEAREIAAYLYTLR